MVTHFDHVTIVVRDVAKAKAFFALLGFIEQQSVVISGGQFSSYMGIPDIEAEHITLALANATPQGFDGTTVTACLAAAEPGNTRKCLIRLRLYRLAAIF